MTDNRARILDAAERLFATRGFAATSVREIVREAGVTNPMLYYYFGSKEDLFVHLIRERFQTFARSFSERLAQQDTVHGVLSAWAHATMEGTREFSTSIRLVFASVFAPHEGMPMDVVLHESAGFLSILYTHIARVAPDVEEERRHLALFFFRGALDNLIHIQLLRPDAVGNNEEFIQVVVDRVAAMFTDTLPTACLPLLPGLGCL
jgi:AcrR family transcriptional regulator